jgi:hypothetical protein
MSSLNPQLPLKLGRSVQHRSNLGRVGIILGWVFDPPLRALVRWQHGGSTYEAPDDLMDLADVLGISETMSIAEMVRRRIESGILPGTAPATTATIKQSKWHPCDACDELIAPGQVVYAVGYHTPPRVLRLHRGCHGVWEVERQRRQSLPTPTTPRSFRGMAADEVRCPVCQQPIHARQSVVFRRDGHVEHVACTEATRKPLARLVSETAADPICPGCSEPIRATDSVAKDGGRIVHMQCLIRRPIAGGQALPAWTLIGDEHIGRRLGTTPAGHREFMAACAEVSRASASIVARARRAVADTRAARHGTEPRVA